ncbi:MAG: flagellar motor protein MotB [Elusimicrobiota bacterium]
MAKKHKCPEHVNHERWLVSYADFITLLFAFFTVLYAISNTDSKKVEKFVGSAERSFNEGIFAAGSQSLTLGEVSIASGNGMYDMGINMTDVEDSLKSSMTSEEKEGKVSIEKNEDGLLITLKTFGFFESGSDQLNAGSADVIKKIGQDLKRIPNNIRINGHTDNTPITSGRFSSNWELSTARSVAVLKSLLETGISADRFIVSGYAEFYPVASNRYAQGRAKNRRVEIFVAEKPDKKKRFNLMDLEKEERPLEVKSNG